MNDSKGLEQVIYKSTLTDWNWSISADHNCFKSIQVGQSELMRWLGPLMATVKPDSAIVVDFVIVRF
ncbi:hypothetical protein [Methylobacter sp.]|jgi:hypothetical protein|uniref:hypothetical protein n=1 Tax=Methylobacter sp. TaxID=2051955 RepID=UPI003DA2F811